MNNGIFKLQVFRRRKPACKVVATLTAFSLLVATPVSALAATSYLNGNAELTAIRGASSVQNTDTLAQFQASGGHALLDWSKLNVGAGQTMDFLGSATFYNVVNGSSASQIAGTLKAANGNLWIFNPSGISFMNGSQVNVGGTFGAIAGALENRDAIADAIDAGGTVPAMILGSASATVTVGGGEASQASPKFTADKVALIGKAVTIQKTSTVVGDKGPDFSEVGKVAIGAGKVAGQMIVDEVGGGSVAIQDADWAVADDDIYVDVGNVNVGDGESHAGDLEILSEGNIKVSEAVVAKGDIAFKTLAKEGATAPVVGHKQISVASGKLLQGKSVSAIASGKIDVEGSVSATSDITMDGTLTQIAGTIDASGKLTLSEGAEISAKVAANAIDAAGKTVNAKTGADIDVTTELKAATLDVDGGTVDAATVVAKVDQDGGAVKATTSITGDVEIDGLSSTLETAKIAGKLTQVNGEVKTAEVTGMVGQSGGKLVAQTADLTLGGKLTQTAGEIDAAKLTLSEGAEISAKVAANAIDADGKTVNAKTGADIDVTTELKAATLDVDDGAVDAATIVANVDQDGGTVSVTTVNGDVKQSAGTIKAGTDAGLTINGAVTQDAGSILADNGDVAMDAGTTKDIALKGDVKANSGSVILNANNVTVDGDADGASVEGKGGVTVTAANTFTVKESAIVKAGQIDEATLTAGDAKAMTIDAQTVAINTGAKVGASGTLGVSTDALAVNNAKVAAGEAMTFEAKTAAGTVTIENGAVVAGKKTVTVGNASEASKTPATLAVNNAQVVAAEDLTANAGKIDIQNGAKVASDKNVALAATTGDITIQSGAQTLAAETVTLTAANDVALDAATVAGKGGVTLAATAGDVKASSAAVVKAGDFTADEQTGAITVAKEGNLLVTAGDGISLDNAKAGASGTATLTAKGADGVKLTTAKLASEKDLAVTAEAGDIAVAGSTVATHGQANLTATAGKIAVTGASQVKAADALTATAQSVEVNASTVASDKTLTLTSTESTIDVAGGAQVMARETLTINAKTVATIDGATVAGKDAVSVTAGTTFAAKNNAKVGASGTLGVSTDALAVNNAQVVAAEDLTANAGKIDIQNGAKVASDKNVALAATTGDITIQSGAQTLAAETVTLTAANDVALDAATVKAKKDVLVEAKGDVQFESGLVKGGENVRLSNEQANGRDVAIAEAATVEAGKNATVVAANNAVVDGQVKASTESVYIKAGQDILLGGGALVSAGAESVARATANNALLEAGRDIRGIDGDSYAMVKAGSAAASGVVALDADGNAGENITVDAEGIATHTAGDVTLNLFGDVSLAVKSDGNVTVNHEGGTLSVVSGGSAVAAAKVNEVKSDATLEEHELTTFAQGMDGIHGQQVAINGTYGSSVSVQSVVEASGDARVDVDGSIAVDGSAKAGGNLLLMTDADISVAGEASADTAELVAGTDIAVNGTIDATTASLGAGENVAFGSEGQVSATEATVTAEGNITQDGAKVSVDARGYASKATLSAAVRAKTVTLSAGGSIGSGNYGYVTVGGGKVKATAGRNASIASAGSETLNVASVSAGDVSLYTAGKLNTMGTVKAKGATTVTAREFGSISMNSFGGALTVNNFSDNVNPLLAIFRTQGGLKEPTLNNLPNNSIVFIDGRLAGGDIQTINRLGAVEAFPVQTPELKSEQGVFGNPIFLHDELDVANPLAVGAIDFLLQDIPRLTLSSDFPLEVERQVAATGLNPKTSYRFGQKDKTEENAEPVSPDEGKSEKKPSVPNTDGKTAMN